MRLAALLIVLAMMGCDDSAWKPHYTSPCSYAVVETCRETAPGGPEVATCIAEGVAICDKIYPKEKK